MKLAPILQASKIYEKEECARTFQEDLESHLLHGFMVSTPEYFIMGRPVIRGKSKTERDRLGKLILDPDYVFAISECNCWHIWLMAGDVSKCWDYYPYPMKWVSWEISNKIRYYSMKPIIRKTTDYDKQRSILAKTRILV